MTPSLQWSLRAYARLLVLYPEDLRREFGADMLEAFADDLGGARGIAGTLSVWRSAARELMHIALPAWFDTPAVMVPLLSAATVAASYAPMLIVTARRKLLMNLPGEGTLAEVLISISIACAVSALTSFVATYRWKRAGLITLRLG
jgi:hypothetical protein